MEGAAVVPESTAKYQKLASEYSKLRAQASVLKKAVLEEQAKNGGLRDQLRQRESALRRCEQEADSLGFRNKQMEHRVASLQEELAIREGRSSKKDKDGKQRGSNKKDAAQTARNGDSGAGAFGSELAQDAIIFEELQKKIMENAQLTSLLDDKERELQLHTEHIGSLEQTLEKRVVEHSEQEKRLRRELEQLQCRNSELETKLVEAASMLGSEDALSVSGSDHTPLHNNQLLHHNHASSFGGAASASATNNANSSSEERITCLEKEVSYWRTQYEIAHLHDHGKQVSDGAGGTGAGALGSSVATVAAAADGILTHQMDVGSCDSSMSAAGLTVKPSFAESKSAQRARDSLQEPPTPPTKEQLIYNNFSKKYEDLLKAKCMAESRVSSYETEAEHLQNCLENATHELKSKDEQMQSIGQALQMLEEDLATTRINYEEQISALTEQVISLSEQLAACK